MSRIARRKGPQGSAGEGAEADDENRAARQRPSSSLSPLSCGGSLVKSALKPSPFQKGAGARRPRQPIDAGTGCDGNCVRIDLGPWSGVGAASMASVSATVKKHRKRRETAASSSSERAADEANELSFV